MGISRRQFLLGAAGLGVAAAGYARFIESGWLELRRTEIPPCGLALARPLKILQLSDLHWSRSVPLSLISRAVGLGLAAQPDLVCLTGDYVTAGEQRDLARLSHVLAPLAAAAPALAVLGNHDGGAWSRAHGGPASSQAITGMLEQAGFTVLVNRAHTLTLGGLRVCVGGAADLWAGEFDAPALGAELERGRVDRKVLLAHNSDVKGALDEVPWDVMLCGHTHGGQVCLPLLGAPVVPVQDRNYIAGLRRWRARWIYTSRGVGSLFGVRWNCRPEVSLLTLA